MPDSLLQSAVKNNAEWCELVAASHHIDSNRDSNAWFSSEETPPFSPNLVTLRAGIKPEQIVTCLEALPERCGLKDSYADLDLTPYGFRVGFQAHWYGLSGSIQAQLDTESVHEVSSEETLVEWVLAWGETPNGKTIFRSELLQPKVRFFFVEKDGKVDSGIIANLSDDVVGISNFFGQADGIAQCIGAASLFGNGLPLVGYGSKEELNELAPLGFIELGELSVWLR